MKTIAEFKRRIVKGAKIHTIYHLKFAGRCEETGEMIYKDDDRGIREVSIVQTNSFALGTVQSGGNVIDSWCAYPKKDEIKFIDNDTVQIMDYIYNKKNEKLIVPCLTYKFIT